MVINMLVGTALLTLGRKLFWLFVGGIGFIAGISLAARFMGDQSQGMVLLIGILGGLLGAGLAVLLKKFAIALAGFVAGGYVFIEGLRLLGFTNIRLDWVLFLVGGVIGSILITKLFEWGLILLSSLSGALIIAQALPVEGQMLALVAMSAFVLGVVFQSGLLRDKGRKQFS